MRYSTLARWLWTFWFLVASPTNAQNIITTFAGGEWLYPRSDRTALNAPLGTISSLTFALNGDLLIADSENAEVIRVSPGGISSIFAGSGTPGYGGDGGPASSALLSPPTSVAADSKGNVYISSNGIRKVAPNGTITTLSSAPTRFLAIDPSGNLYAADRNHVYRVSADGTPQLIAGTGNYCSFGCAIPKDGTAALLATFDSIQGLGVDPAGNLFIGDAYQATGLIYRLAPSGLISTFATGIAAWPMASDGSGNLYVPDLNSAGAVRRISSSGIVTTVAGDGTRVYSGDGGPATLAGIGSPSAVAVDKSGTVYVADGARVRAFQPGGTIRLFAGNGQNRFSGDGGPATLAVFNYPRAIATDRVGNTYIGDNAGRIRRINAAGIVTSFAGTGLVGFSGDGGPAVNANISEPTAMALDGAGSLYFSDAQNNASAAHLRKISPDGIVTTPKAGIPPPYSGMTFDPAGNLFVSQFNSVFRIDPQGKTLPVAGSGAPPFNGGYNGDNIPANQALLHNPAGLVIDAGGNLLIADTGNSRVRKVSPAGIITTLANVSGVTSLAISSSGIIFAGGTSQVSAIVNGIVSNYAGGNSTGASGDGVPATAAQIAPDGIALDPAGNLLIAEATFRDVRKVLSVPPAFLVSTATLTFQTTAGAPSPAPLSIVLSGTAGTSWAATTTMNDGPLWLNVSAPAGSVPAAIQAIATTQGLPAGLYISDIVFSSIKTGLSWTVRASLNVLPNTPPKLFTDQTVIVASAATGNQPASRHFLSIQNLGGGIALCHAAATTKTGGTWLSVSGDAISVLAGIPYQAPILISAAGLSTGSYSGQIVITGANSSGLLVIPVQLSVYAAASGPVMSISQTALIFRTVASGGKVPPQSFSVLNAGSGILNWTAAAKLFTAPNWLSVAPGTGASVASPANAPQVVVSVNASGLPPGSYGGEVSVTEVGAASGQYPQTRGVLVNLTVLPAGASLPPLVKPAGVIFTDAGAPPGPQQILISNAGGQPLSFSSETDPSFAQSPAKGSIPPGQSLSVNIQPASSVGRGVTTGKLRMSFSDGSVTTVDLLEVLTTSPAASAAIHPNDIAQCTASKKLGLYTSPANYDAVNAFEPLTLSVRIVDDCGKPAATGTVTAYFSAPASFAVLNSIGDGNWEGTWTPSAAGNLTTITVLATGGDNQTTEISRLNVRVNAASGVELPFVFPAGVTSAAASSPGSPLAQGGLIAIYGSGFAGQSLLGSGDSLPTMLGDVQVNLGSRPIPLLYVSPGQIDAIVPYDAPTGIPLPLQVAWQGFTSPAEPVVVAAAQPAVFLQPQISSSQGAIVGPTGLASVQAPASAGDVVVVYCTGLGTVSPAISAGLIAPITSLFTTVNPVTVSIGGQQAVVQFAGLAPASIGEYQINVIVPSGIAAGDSVPLVITAGGQTSAVVTLAVK